MKIALVVCVFPPYKGGIGNTVFYFACELAKHGHEITVFTPEYNDQDDGVNFSSFKIERFKPWFQFGNSAFIPQIYSKLANFDIIHLHYPFFGGAEAVVLKRLLNKKPKLAIHYHMDAVGSGAKGFLFEMYRLFVLPLAMSAADVITCASLDYVGNSQISDYYKSHKEKFYEIVFGVDTEKFKPSLTKEPNKKKNILFVGTLDKAHFFKGLDILLMAIQVLEQKKITDLQLNIVGDGDLQLHFQKIAKDLCAETEINFLGKVSDEELVKNYQKADVFVLPSINKGEAFGLVLLEAMASGVPVIASDLPGVRGVFQDKEQGLLFSPNNPEDLADKILSILTNDELANVIGEAGRRLAFTKYSWGQIGHDLNNIYEDLLNK